MNKKCFHLLLILFFVSSPAFSDDFFDAYSGINNSWIQNKPVTNQEFEKAIETLQADQKKKEAKAKKKKIKKVSGGGTSLHSNLDPSAEILSQDPVKDKKNEGRLLNIPVNMVIDNKLLEKGFYNVYGEKDKDGNVYLNFYQSQYLAGKVKAIETDNDWNEENIDFVNYIPCDNNTIKVIFGSLNFNAYAYIRYFDED